MAKKYLLFAGKEIDADKQTVEVNQVIQLEGYSYDKYVVYEIAKNQWGITYKLINLRTKEFGTSDLIRPLSEKFGIGHYYDDKNPQFLDAFEVAVLRQEAQAKADSDAKAVIIACEREDNSDPYTDYYSASTVHTLILGFSTHTKNNFQEMRNHAGNFGGTAYLTEKNEEYEHRENYTGGHGYYLGESKYHGWIIEKEQIYDREHFIERYAYTAGDEANIRIKVAPQAAEATETAVQPTGNYTIVNYSEKSVAIFGDTKAIKKQLAALGGRFNMYLALNGKKCAGWIFQKSKEDDLRRLVNLN